MAAPGHRVTFIDNGSRRTVPGDDTRQAFIVAEAERGPLTPRRITSLAGAVTLYGGRQSYSYLYDALETAFAEGAPAVWISRVAAGAAVQASRALADGTTTTLTVRAIGPGVYGNSQYVEVLTNAQDSTIPVGSFQIRYYDGGTTAAFLVEASPVFVDKTAALAWAPASGMGNAQYFTLTDAAGTADPVALSPTALTGGDDQRGALADADWQIAIDKFTIEYGPGQVAMIGQTTAARQLMVIAHAVARNRHAVLDLADTPTIATLTGAVTTVNAAPSNGARLASTYWPWHRIPPLAGQYGYRTVPPSAAMLGLMARAELEGGDPGVAAAGEQHGVFRFVQGLSQDVASITEANMAVLNDAGVNVARIFYGLDNPVQYGNRTPRSRGTDAVWAEASGSRLAMGVAARCDEVMRMYVHRRVNPVVLAQLQGELAAVLEPLRLRGALYGDTPAEAYAVDATSDAVNPASQLELGTLVAAVSYRTSPSPERVELRIARVSITTTLA